MGSAAALPTHTPAMKGPMRLHRAIVRLTLVVATALAAPALGGPLPASASDSWSFGPKPLGDGPTRSYLIYELQPGSVISDVVRLSNSTDAPLTFYLYARDASTASDGTGYVIQTFDESPVDAGSWVRLPAEAAKYTLRPRTSADIPVTLTVPTNATPGDHAGAVVAELVGDADSSGGVEVRARIATRMYVRVTGDLRPDMVVSSIDLDYGRSALGLSGPVTVSYTIRNVGNVRLSPQVGLELKDGFGRTIRKAALRDFRDVLPNGSIEVTEEFENVRALVRLRAEVVATTSGQTPATARGAVTIWAIPWIVGVLALGVVVLVALIILVRMLIRRRASRR